MKKDDIINISLELFLEKGYEKTTITDIMKKAKLSKGGMYHYFASKEDIFNAAVEKALIEEQTLFEKAVNMYDSLEEKLVLLFMNTSTSSDYMNKFSFFIQQEQNSLIFYRLRELFRKKGFENLKKLLIDGQKTKKINIDMKFIDEVSRTTYNCGEDIAYRALAVSDKKSFFQKEFIAFFYIVERLLNPSKEFNEKFKEKLLEMSS